jgi:3-oxoacyl-[acyl-carrier protein] reductase
MTKYALITGASRGLGKAIALRLATDGFAVIINYQSNKEAAEDTLKQVQEAGGTGELLPFDVSNPQAIDTALESWQMLILTTTSPCWSTMRASVRTTS